MATAEQTYVDPSALLKLYLHERESAAMNAWRARTRGALPITPHGCLEIVNAIRLAQFRGLIEEDAAADALASFDEDLEEGRYVTADVLWRATLRRGIALARDHTAAIGSRSLDLIHVAAAVELGFKQFVTFDHRQQQLARLAGLKLVVPRRRA